MSFASTINATSLSDIQNYFSSQSQISDITPLLNMLKIQAPDNELSLLISNPSNPNPPFGDLSTPISLELKDYYGSLITIFNKKQVPVKISLSMNMQISGINGLLFITVDPVTSKLSSNLAFNSFKGVIPLTIGAGEVLYSMIYATPATTDFAFVDVIQACPTCPKPSVCPSYAVCPSFYRTSFGYRSGSNCLFCYEEIINSIFKMHFENKIYIIIPLFVSAIRTYV